MPKEDLTPDARARLRRFTFSAIFDISNTEKQRKVWLNPQHPCDNALEYIEGFRDNDYDGSGSFDFLRDAELAIVRPFIDALEEYEVPDGWANDDAAILQDPNWLRVTQIAATAVDQLIPMITDQDERRHLTEGARVIRLPGGGQRLE